MSRNTFDSERAPLLSKNELKEWKLHVPVSDRNDEENSLENMSSSSNFLQSSNQTTHGQEHFHRRRDETPSPHTEVCVYLKRWYILAVFSSL